MIKAELPYVVLDGDRMGYQFNRTSNGKRWMHRRVTHCKGCGVHVVSFRSTTFKVELDRSGRLWEGVEPHDCYAAAFFDEGDE